jgi:hypothetical protein
MLTKNEKAIIEPNPGEMLQLGQGWLSGPCVEPVFFAWGQKFRYDHRGFFSHYRADCFGRMVLSPNVPTSTETMLANLQDARRGVESAAVGVSKAKKSKPLT